MAEALTTYFQDADEIWLQATGVRAALLRLLPWPARRVDMTLSFTRRPALATTPPDKRV
jgi:hypothetical protein